MNQQTYETTCIELGVTPLTEAELRSAYIAFRHALPEPYQLDRQRDTYVQNARRQLAARPARLLDCGHTAAPGMAMAASTGTSCPDCYDRMSH